MARAMHRRCICPPERPSALSCKTVFRFIPKRGALQAALDSFVEDALGFDSRDAQGIDDVFVDGFWKRIGLLEDHSNAAPQSDDLNLLVVYAPPIEKDISFVTHAIDQVVHPVEVSKQRGLAASGRPYEGGHLSLGNVHVDVVERLLLAVVKVEVASLQKIGTVLGRSRCCG